jgi:hypothetical protein
MGVPKKHFLPL